MNAGVAELGQMRQLEETNVANGWSLSGCEGSNPFPCRMLNKRKMRTGPENPELRNLIRELKLQNASLWKRIAYDLEKPTRKRREVNVSRINKYINDNEIAVVPGKVLGAGEIKKSVIVAAWQFSEQAKEKILKAKGSCITIQELLKKKPKLSQVRIIG